MGGLCCALSSYRFARFLATPRSLQLFCSRIVSRHLTSAQKLLARCPASDQVLYFSCLLRLSFGVTAHARNAIWRERRLQWVAPLLSLLKLHAPRAPLHVVFPLP